MKARSWVGPGKQEVEEKKSRERERDRRKGLIAFMLSLETSTPKSLLILSPSVDQIDPFGFEPLGWTCPESHSPSFASGTRRR